MTEQKLEKIFSDKKYIQKLLKLNSPEKLCRELLNKNIKISLEDAEKILLYVDENKKNNFQPVDDRTLENVSGGKSAAYYISRPSYYAGYVIGKVPMVGMIAYHMVKGAIEQLKGDL